MAELLGGWVAEGLPASSPPIPLGTPSLPVNAHMDAHTCEHMHALINTYMLIVNACQTIVYGPPLTIDFSLIPKLR